MAQAQQGAFWPRQEPQEAIFPKLGTVSGKKLARFVPPVLGPPGGPVFGVALLGGPKNRATWRPQNWAPIFCVFFRRFSWFLPPGGRRKMPPMRPCELFTYETSGVRGGGGWGCRTAAQLTLCVLFFGSEFWGRLVALQLGPPATPKSETET